MQNRIEFDVWGARGSRNLVPARSAIANHTSCYSVLDGDELFVLDAGRGLAALGHALRLQPRFAGVRTVHVLVTHAHMDHWEGLKDADWFWLRGNGLAVRIHGTAQALRAIQAGYAHPGYVPLELLARGTVSRLEYVPLAPGEKTTVGRWRLRTAPLNHYSGEGSSRSILDTLGFRIESPSGAILTYLSDHEPTDATAETEEAMVGGAHLVVYDAHFADRSQHAHGHGSQEHAAGVARRHPATLFLAGHHGPGFDDGQVRAAQQRHAGDLPNFDVAVEGTTYAWSGDAFVRGETQAFMGSVVPDAQERKKARHDLRTPINQIVGYSEMLAEQADEEGRSADVADLQKIRAAARRQLEMIERLFAEPGAGPTNGPGSEMVSVPAAGPVAEAGTPAAGPVPAAPEAPPHEHAEDAGGESDHGAILVVDDNELNRDMLSRRLAARGFTVSTAENGQQALDLVAAGEPELILLDVMMPGISGIDVLRTLRTTWAASDLPIIMATARDASEDIVEALRLGANDYVTKPLDFPVVMARVQAQLALKRQKDEIERLAEGLERRNRFIKNTFGRYLSDQVVEGLLDSPEGLRLGGESRAVTILMSDLRGFTAVSERLGPEQVVRMLNIYLGAMAEVIFEYHGTIDEFIGDAILAIYGAPISREDDARRAVACAVSMQLAMQEVNVQLVREGLPRVEMGIAVHSGDVVVGNIGSERRTKYGIVGPPVNMTGRIESYTVGGQVLVSEATLKEAGPDVQVGERIHVRAKGSQEPLVVYDLVGIAGGYELYLPKRDETLRWLSREIPIRYALLEGKRVGDDLYEGVLVRASATGGEVRAPHPLRALSNLQIQVLDAGGEPLPGDLYAKVVDSAGDQGTFLVRFTSVPPAVEDYLRGLVASTTGKTS